MKQASRNILAPCMLSEVDGDAPECQRKFGRLRLQAVRCSGGDIEDLSRTGMRVRSRRLMKPSAEPRVFKIDTGDEKISILGRVMWAAKGDRGRKHAGIEFMNVTDEQRDTLQMLARGAAANSQMSSRMYGRVS